MCNVESRALHFTLLETYHTALIFLQQILYNLFLPVKLRLHFAVQSQSRKVRSDKVNAVIV